MSATQKAKCAHKNFTQRKGGKNLKIMKIISYILLALIIGCAGVYIYDKDFFLGRIGMSFSQRPANAAQTDSFGNATKSGKRILIAYYSWGGNTRKVAQSIHKEIGGDIIEIRTVKPYPDGYKEAVKAYKEEYDNGNVRDIVYADIDISKYDYIVLGYPIWYHKQPLMIEKFLKNINTDGKTILPFATSGGTKLDESLASLKTVVPNAKIGEGLLANDTSLITGWLKRNELLAP